MFEVQLLPLLPVTIPCQCPPHRESGICKSRYKARVQTAEHLLKLAAPTCYTVPRGKADTNWFTEAPIGLLPVFHLYLECELQESRDLVIMFCCISDAEKCVCVLVHITKLLVVMKYLVIGGYLYSGIANQVS